MPPPDQRGVFYGYHWDLEKEEQGVARFYTADRHGLVCGPTGTGKTARFILNNLLAHNLDGESLILIDPKAELAAVSALIRKDRGDEVYIIDPFGVLRRLIEDHPDPEFKRLMVEGLTKSVGFDPLAHIDWRSPDFYDDCAALAEALIQIQGGETYWAESAQGLITGLIMWEIVRRNFIAERMKNEADKRPNLPNVRMLLTAAETEGPDPFAPPPASKDAPVLTVPLTGLRRTARDVIGFHSLAVDCEAKGETYDVSAAVLEIIASLLSRFDKTDREIMSVRATADTQTRWLLSPPIAADLRKEGRDFRALKTRRTVCFIILPSDRLRTHSAWLRMIIVTAIRRLSIGGGIKTRIFIDEMPALGYLPPLADAYAQIRGYNVCLIGIIQDLNQLKALYKDWWESFAANAGFTICFSPNDMTSGEWISRRAGQEFVWMPTSSESGLVIDVDPSKRTAGKAGSYQLQAIMLPQRLFALASGVALTFRAGHGKAAIVRLPLYMENRAAVKKYLPNPLHRD